ncbi:MAG: O-antigen ligase family protein [Planctomycetota bacterium]|nr:O-antigen ligase family protein [Planctomycetota bacterium]
MTVKMWPRTNQTVARVDWRAMITLAAFVLALSTAAARCTILETLRDPISPATGGVPRGPAPTVSLLLDLLCCVPALLVLVRRVVDDTYILRFSLSQVLMVPLAAWMALSFHQADDKFAMLVATCNFVAALALLWAMSQLVRSWLRLRIVAATTYGLLLVFLVQGFFWKLVEFPDLRQSFVGNRAQILRQQGYDPDSFIGKQFERRVLSGEMMGFNTSPNSFAAMIVLLMTIGMGAALQRLADLDSLEWPLGLALVAPLAVAMLYFTGSKAALASPFIATGMLVGIFLFRDLLGRHAARAYWIGVGTVGLAILMVIGHGLYHHGLPTDSLNFRWRYWVASWRMFWRHPVAGVGWNNFGGHYVRDRLPAASEEIQDPHNFIIRFFVELGAVGGIMLLVWMLRMGWELTRPVAPAAMSTLSRDSARAVRWIFAIPILAIFINVLASLDFSQNINFTIIELMKRGLFLCAFALGALVVSLRSVDSADIDDRAAPWVLYALLVGIGVFLIHNLIEFSIFEPGPMCFFAVLVGTALGVRKINPGARKNNQQKQAIAALATAGAVWIAAWVFIFIPTARAESAAHTGDVFWHDEKLSEAAGYYQKAYAILPMNADYAFRAGRAFYRQMQLLKMRHVLVIPQEVWQPVFAWYSTAIQTNPSFIRGYLARAGMEVQMADPRGTIEDYTRALELDPNEVSIRIDYARALERLMMPNEAAVQLERALADNNQLDAMEPKRLSAQQIEAIRAEIAVLNRDISTRP